MTDANLIPRFIQVLTDQSIQGSNDAVDALTAEGVAPETAETLLAFVPIAFVHVVLADTGATFSPAYVIRDLDTGQSARGLLRNDPTYTAAVALAQRMVAGEPHEIALAREVARYSSEWNALNQLLHNGGELADCVLTEPLLARLPIEYITRRRNQQPRSLASAQFQPASTAEPEPETSGRSRPWWKFW